MSTVKREIVNELHKPARRNFRRRRTIIKDIGDLWQTDLGEFQRFAKENRGHRYILIVIDCYSKFVWAKPLKNKTATEVHNAMKNVLQEANYSPKHLQSDFGSEFYNRQFSSLMKQYNIKHYSTFSTKKAAIVERVIRTLKNWLYKEFSIRGNYKWIDILPNIINLYNNKVHRTIGMKPVDVNYATKLTAYNHPKVALKPKFHVGDTVRISKYKGVFEKGYTANYSTELFKIVKVNVTNPITYMIEDVNGQPIKGCFYECELQKTKYPDIYLVERILKKKGNKFLVKWLGLPTQQNEWINKSDIV